MSSEGGGTIFGCARAGCCPFQETGILPVSRERHLLQKVFCEANLSIAIQRLWDPKQAGPRPGVQTPKEESKASPWEQQLEGTSGIAKRNLLLTEQRYPGSKADENVFLSPPLFCLYAPELKLLADLRALAIFIPQNWP